MTEELLAELKEILRRANEIVTALESSGLTPEISSTREKKEITEQEISKILKKLGVPANILGYYYIRTGIMMVLEKPELLKLITKEFYPEIAKKYQTTANRVERAIRHAIEISIMRGNLNLWEEIFSYSFSSKKGKPVNGEFIAALVDYLKNQ